MSRRNIQDSDDDRNKKHFYLVESLNFDLALGIKERERERDKSLKRIK